MKIFLNDKSIEDINTFDVESLQIIIAGLAKSLKLVKLFENIHDIHLIGSLESLLEITLKNKRKLIDVIKSHKDEEARGIILSRFSNYIKHDNIHSVKADFSLSFFSKEEWKEISTPVQSLNANFHNLKNIPCLKFCSLSKVIDRSEILTSKLSENKFDYINLDYISHFYTSEFEEAFISLCHSNVPEKRSIILSTADLICRISHFQKHKRASKINERHIYYNKKNNIYISPDFLHGTLEVLNDKGKHCCEINYKGEKLSEADDSGAHDIRLK